MTKVPIKRALVSVYDKTGLTELASALAAAGVEIVSTGSTAAAIAAAGVPVTGVEDVTGFPECLDGRVKTLHPGVHAGLLADPGQPAHRAQLDDLGITPFELLVSNLFPFEETVASGAGPAECVEQIDILAGLALDLQVRCQEPRQGRGHHRPVDVPGGRRGRGGRRVHARPAPAGRRPGLRLHRALRRCGRLLVRRRVRT